MFLSVGCCLQLYPQMTGCSFYTTVVMNDTGLVNVMILLGNILLFSVSFSVFSSIRLLCLQPLPLRLCECFFFWYAVYSDSAEKDFFFCRTTLLVEINVIFLTLSFREPLVRWISWTHTQTERGRWVQTVLSFRILFQGIELGERDSKS